jgi:hypothetical protein
LAAALTADLSRSRSNDLLNSENEKQCGNHGQNRLRITINHDLSSTDVAARQKRNEISMTRIALALLVSGLAINMAAAASDLSQCLDPSTKLDAGGDVSDKELSAAIQACAKLQQSGLDAATRLRVNHAASDLSDEQRHRQKSH